MLQLLVWRRAKLRSAMLPNYFPLKQSQHSARLLDGDGFH